jgi:uncharacterized membrane protein YphA (DoxX/SURF4 family)
VNRWPDLAWTALRLALGALFIYASVHKIISPGSFAQEVNNYRLLPAALVNPFAIVVPWLEFFCGLALVSHRLVLGSSALVALLMTAFTAAVLWAVARHLNVSCGCFSSHGSAATWMTFARDIVLLIAAAANLARVWPKEKWNSPT